MAGQVQLVFEPLSGRFDPQDERWLGQIAGLVTDLRREAGGVSAPREPVTGAKGAVGPIVLSFVSAGS